MGCSLVPVTVSTEFNGVFGTGDAVSFASTLSASPRRRLRDRHQNGVKNENLDNFDDVLGHTGRGSDQREDVGAVSPGAKIVERFLLRRFDVLDSY